MALSSSLRPRRGGWIKLLIKYRYIFSISSQLVIKDALRDYPGLSASLPSLQSGWVRSATSIFNDVRDFEVVNFITHYDHNNSS